MAAAGLTESSIPSPPRDWYLPLARHLGDAYLKYAFTKNTRQEVEFLWDVLQIETGSRVLDVGCGPGRHAVELAARGCEVVGVDLSPDFLNVARARAAEAGVRCSFFEMDAHEMPFEEEFDVVMSICEGAFSLGLDDLTIMKRMAAAARPKGRVAAAAVNVFYVLAHMKDSGEFDPARMLFKESVEGVIGSDGLVESFEMWNSCYTPRELEWLCNGAGLDPRVVYGVSPGAYAQDSPGFQHPELLVVAEKAELVANS